MQPLLRHASLPWLFVPRGAALCTASALCIAHPEQTLSNPSPRAAHHNREFLELGFKYDNLLMEESAQILEIETFIPMLLQVRRSRRNGGCCATRAAGGSRAVACVPCKVSHALLGAPLPCLTPCSARRTGTTD